MVHAYTVGEPAIACAYAMMNKENPLSAAASIISGFHEIYPLSEEELSVLFSLICIRLCLSVCISVYQKKLQPDNEYLTISEKPGWRLLEQLSEIHPDFAHFVFRQACMLEPCTQNTKIIEWLQKNRSQFASVVDADLNTSTLKVFDLSVGSLDFEQPPDAMDLPLMTR